jgi:hypothetical protein
MITASVLMCSITLGQGSGGPVNYLSTPVNLTFNNTVYGLSWTSHPASNYYKQEYIQKGEKSEKFSSMLMIELLNSKVNVKDAAANKISELERMKPGNPYVNYETSYDAAKGEQILDFIITANSPDGKEVVIAERNIYRYTPFVNQQGEKGLLLVAMSLRGYGQDSKKIIENSKSAKADLVSKMKGFKIPPVSLKNGKPV